MFPVSVILLFYGSGLLAHSPTPEPGGLVGFLFRVSLSLDGCFPGLTSVPSTRIWDRSFHLLDRLRSWALSPICPEQVGFVAPTSLPPAPRICKKYPRDVHASGWNLVRWCCLVRQPHQKHFLTLVLTASIIVIMKNVSCFCTESWRLQQTVPRDLSNLPLPCMHRRSITSMSRGHRRHRR